MHDSPRNLFNPPMLPAKPATVDAALADCEHIHFLLLPAFSMMGFVSAIEPLRVATRFRPHAWSSWWRASNRWRLSVRTLARNPVTMAPMST